MKIIPRRDKAAREVLKHIRKNVNIVPRDEHEDIVIVEVYENCRERGFALASCDGRKVAFSEHRNSDSIVVYCGARKDFEMNTNIPSDRVWENAKFFNPGEAQEAAFFILSYLGTQ